MTARDPRRLLRTIRHTTAGSLVVAAVGTGVVAVHLAGDHASAAAATRDGSRAPSGLAAAAPSTATTPSTTPTTTPTTTPHRSHHTSTTSTATSSATTSPATTRSFARVAPVQPGSGSSQTRSHGS